VISEDLIIRQQRQDRIAFLYLKGWTQKEIAVEMHITLRTVQRYYANIRTNQRPKLRGPRAGRKAS
jgi:DNA-binding NarL/FixJ family response regulator